MSTTRYTEKYMAKSNATNPDQTRPAPLLQIRVIGATGYAQAVLADLAKTVRPLLGANVRYSTTTRSARKVGHVRVYLTITRKEAVE